MKATLSLLLLLSAVAPARSSVLYAFTLDESPNSVFSFDCLEPSFIDGLADIDAPSDSVTCALNGVAENCVNVWGFSSAYAVRMNVNTSGVSLYDTYACPDCEFDSFANVEQAFAGLNLQGYGTWTNQTGGMLEISPSPLISFVPEPAISGLCGLAALAGVLLWAVGANRRSKPTVGGL
jgi:hypothetical protein